jgi:transposase
LAKTILVSDHDAWTAQEISQAYLERYEIEQQFRQAKSPSQVALMPQYHWTDAQIRMPIFVCVAALTYLTFLRNRLREAGLAISARGAIEALRELRSVLYWMPGERKPRRMVEEPTETQAAILSAFGFRIEDGRVLHI